MNIPHLIRLMTWLSPAFPVGAFSYSHGIERAIHEGLIRDRATLEDWLDDLLRRGSVWNDAVLFAAAWRQSDPSGFDDVAALGRAMAGSSERYMETMLQGSAFKKAASHWMADHLGGNDSLPYPVAVAQTASLNSVELEPALAAYLHAVMSNLIQGAMRLVPLGQSQGVALIAVLEPSILAVATAAAQSSLTDLGSSAIISEIMAMQHETQYSRVFRS